MEPVVTSSKIATALRALGLHTGDVCVVHSSLKSFGHVAGGAQAVIDAFDAVLGDSGTLMMPTLIQKDFKNAWKVWTPDTPSETGYLTEYFRCLPQVLRSHQPSHSVAARGPLARELTFEHMARGPHLCPYGQYAFSDSSPWRKLLKYEGKIVFLGVNMDKCTLKHAVESQFAEALLSQVKRPERAAALQSRLRRLEDYDTGSFGIWPYFDGVQMQQALTDRGLITASTCGNAALLCIQARQFFDTALALLTEAPEEWYRGDILDWIRQCRAESQ